jgi:hypothetical protein
MVRLKFDDDPNVPRLEGGAVEGSWSAEEGVAGGGVVGGPARVAVRWGLVGAAVLTRRGGFEAGVAPWRAAVWSAARSRGPPSGFARVWKSCDWRPLTGVTGSIMASLSVSSPSSKMGCGRSVGYWRGDDDRLDFVELVVLVLHGVSGERKREG